jgi:acetyl esterase/lipase
MYGPCYFRHPFWKSKLAHVASKIPEGLSSEFMNQVYEQRPIPIEGGISLEGQARDHGPGFKDPRQAFCLSNIANGRVLDVIFPSGDWQKVDPLLNISESFPPTFIVHGEADTMVPLELSQELYSALRKSGVECGMRVIAGEEHTFAAKMKVGSQTWDLHLEGFAFLEKRMKRNG